MCPTSWFLLQGPGDYEGGIFYLQPHQAIRSSGRQITHLQAGRQATISSPEASGFWATSGVSTGILALLLLAKDIAAYSASWI